VDTYSWYRQRRQTPPGRPTPPATQVRLPLNPTPTIGFSVYCRFASENSIPSEADAEDMIWNWLQDNVKEPLREAIITCFEQENLSLELYECEGVPSPPEELLRAFNPGEVEERRFLEATHVVLIETVELLLPPRVGLWAAITAARGLATSLPGAVILDPEYPRLLPLSVAKEPLPEEGYLRAVDHILIPYSHDPRTEQLWMTTRGMGRFGLPDLELRDVPPNLAPSLLPVMNGVAQRLLEAAMYHVQEAGPISGFERISTLPLRSEMTLRMADIRRAYAHSEEEAEQVEDPELSEEIEGVLGESRIRLTVHGDAKREPILIRILPPYQEAQADTGDMGIWLNSLLTDLIGSDPQLAVVETGDEAMEAAHQNALAELPRIRTRFQNGFRLGEVLHIKHGFPIPGGAHEYMWIAVTGWREGRIRGQLANDPQYRSDLRAGQNVEIGEEEVYDWLIVHTDGSIEGAFTNRLLETENEF